MENLNTAGLQVQEGEFSSTEQTGRTEQDDQDEQQTVDHKTPVADLPQNLRKISARHIILSFFQELRRTTRIILLFSVLITIN